MAINLHLYPSPIEFESRILRETGALARGGRFDEIHIVGTAAPHLPAHERLDGVRVIRRFDVPDVPLPRPLAKAAALALWTRRIEHAYRDAALACVNPHSLTVLPLAARLKRATGARLVYDTHELETETASSSPLRKLLTRPTERRLIPHADAVIVVGDEINAWYRRSYGIERVTTVKNYPGRPPEGDARTARLRGALGLPGDALVFLYQGLLSKGRSIEQCLDAFRGVPADRHLVFLGYGPLEPLVRERAAAQPNVHLHPAVPPEEVLAFTRDADVGLAMIEPISLSYRYCLPNKLLEYLSVGVPPVVSDLPEMVREIEMGRLGWVSPPGTEALHALFRALTPADVAARRARLSGWSEVHNWEREAGRLLAVYDGMFSRRPSAARAPIPAMQPSLG